jgi:hypothetical protein
MAEAVLGLAAISSRFLLSPASKQPATPKAWITLRPKKPVLVRVVERKHGPAQMK